MRLVLGTAQFGLAYGIANQSGQVTRKEVKSMLQLALANSMNMLDTAIAYGDSEMYLGQAGSESFRIITKLPPLPDSIIDVGSWIQQQVNGSLSRLGVAKIYGLLLHRPDQLLSSNGVELYQGLQNLKDNGKVEKIGISIYSPSELDLLMSRYRFDLVQAPFNLVDQRLYSTGWLYRLKDSNVEIHTRSAFLQGLLLMSQPEIPNKFSAWNNLWCSWNSWLLAHNISAVQASLAFPLSFSEIDQVIVGADNANQLSQIISAAKWRADIRLPNLKCDDENLINPANWNQL
jgi:aryl-alcohol dehydrogenase-like predicted oxidoreductase